MRTLIEKIESLKNSEIKNVIDKRISEAYRLGFKTCILPHKNYKKDLADKNKINLIPVKSIIEVSEFLGV